MISVDSSVWIDHLNDDRTPEVSRLRAILSGEEAPLVLCDTVLHEVVRGLPPKQAAAVERDMRLFRVEPASDGADAAVRAADRYRALRARGFTPGHADLLIASWCLDRGFRLLHDDGAFDRMEALLGLAVERP